MFTFLPNLLIYTIGGNNEPTGRNKGQLTVSYNDSSAIYLTVSGLAEGEMSPGIYSWSVAGYAGSVSANFFGGTIEILPAVPS
jgi:hypothetical protein